jgi:phage terminase large subunit GpA-like protein
MPFKQGAIQFVQGRIDQIIDSNSKLSDQFVRTDNARHKQTAEGVNFYIRGTNIVTELREIPVDFEVWDERDKMVDENLTEALARMDGSKIRKYIEASTPTAPGHGVDADESWRASDQHRWHVPCPHCGRKQVLDFESNCLPWVGDKPRESELHLGA